MSSTETDFVVVGSGYGGATVARQLTRAGREVLLLEQGWEWSDHPVYGTYPGTLLYADGHLLLFSKEGLNIIRPPMVGSTTSMYSGRCSRSPHPAGRLQVDQAALSVCTVVSPPP